MSGNGACVGTIVFQDSIITDDDVHTVLVEDISEPGRDGRSFKIDVIDNDPDEPLETYSVNISATFLAIHLMTEADLYAYLVQFRDQLPETVTSKDSDIFAYPNLSRNKKIAKVGRLLETFFKSNSGAELDPGVLRNSVKIEFFEILSILDYWRENEVVREANHSAKSVFAAQGWQLRLQEILKELETESVPKKVEQAPKTGGGRFSQTVTAVRQCRTVTRDGATCREHAIDGIGCIFHADMRDKDLGDFEKAIAYIVKGSPVPRFEGFVFPIGFKQFAARLFTKVVVFDNCVFYDSIDFRDKVFRHALKLTRCRFEGYLDFGGAVFEGDVEMSYLKIKRLSLRNAKFCSHFLFEGNDQQGGETGRFDFGNAVFQDPAKILFRRVFLPDLLLDGCDLSRVSFLHFVSIDVNAWKDPMVENWRRRAAYLWWTVVRTVAQWSRDVAFRTGDELRVHTPYRVGNEFILGQKTRGIKQKSAIVELYDHIRQIYQRLQTSMLSSRNHHLAGRFHIREMEMARLSKSALGRILGSFALYKYLANYGERARQPFLILVLMLFAVPAILQLFMGDSAYTLTWDPAKWSSGFEGYARDFVNNLRTLFYLKGDIDNIFRERQSISLFWHLLFIIERVFAVILVTLTVLALRRRFKRY